MVENAAENTREPKPQAAAALMLGGLLPGCASVCASSITCIHNVYACATLIDGISYAGNIDPLICLRRVL